MEYIKLREVISSAKTERCGASDYPVLSITKSDGVVLQSDKFKKRIASTDTEQYKLVKRGQLVQGIHIDEANFGIQSIVDIGIVSPAYKIWNVDFQKIVPKYLETVLRSPRSVRYYSSKFNGSVKRRERIADNDFLAMEIPFPSKEQQQYAVDVLEKASNMTTLYQQQLQKLDDLVKARFVEMFESVQWNTVRASSIMSNMRNGVSPSNRGHIPAKVLTLSAITQGAFDPSKWKDGMFDTNPPVEKRVCTTDFYMCRGNGNKNLVGTGVYSTKNRFDLVFPDTVIAASIDLQRVCMPYLAYVWKRQAVRKQIESGARTTNGTYKVNQGVISSVEIPLPPIELQAEFADFVKQIDKSKAVIQKALDEIQLLFDSLMQEYFG